MDVRPGIRWASSQYDVDPEVIDFMSKFESGYDRDVVNDWDSNALAGTPSKGHLQFIEDTYRSFADQAKKANPTAWRNVKDDWLNPTAQSLAAAWAVANGHGKHWTTYGRALKAAGTSTPKLAGNAAQPRRTPAESKYGLTQVAPLPGAPGGGRSITAGLLKADDGSDTFLSGFMDRRAQRQVAQPKIPAPAQALEATARQQVRGAKGSDAVRAKLVETARAEVGNTADEAMKYISAAGGTGYEPWCGDLVEWVFRKNGLKPPPARSVPRLLEWAKGNGSLSQQGRAGDLALFDWDSDGTPDHVELVAGGRGQGRYQTIGGNTSGPRGSSTVAIKDRRDHILGFVNAIAQGAS